ncbi:Ras-GEF domain-containing protein [Entamoeba marina]
MKCIKIAKRCLDYNDFNLSYIFYSVLSKISTTQRSTWNKLDKKFIQRYDNLQEIFSIRRNHNNYRILYESRPYPKIPILSLWMHDIVNINEISTFNGEDKKYVNFNKIRLLSTHLKSLKTPQMTKFPFERDDGIVNLLLKLTMI